MTKAKKIRKAPRASQKTRADGWSSTLTGLGNTAYDKRLGSAAFVNVLDQESAEVIWRGDDIAARIVETIPNEMLREGWEVEAHDGKDESEELDIWSREIGIVEACRSALFYRRAYGGAAIFVGADDGKDLELPLDETAIKEIKFLTVLTPRELPAVRWYSDPRAPKYGEVSHYRLMPIDAPYGAPVDKFPIIHESRLVRFDGVKTSRWQALRNAIAPGWNDSIYVRCIQVVQDFQHAWHAASILIQDFAPPVLKMKGLFNLLQSKKAHEGDAGAGVAGRLRALEMSRSVARVALLDSEEEYKRETTNIAGLPDILEKMMSRLAAAVDMPVSLLMGNSPSGLNSTGDSEMRWFYDRVSAAQKRELRPALRRIYRLAMLAKSGPTKGVELGNWEVCFKPLWQLTATEQAQLRKTQAEADKAYVDAGVLLPEEVARSRFGGDSYSTDTHVDLALREQMRAQAETQTKAEPPTPLAPGETP